MISLLRKWRKENLNSIGKYLLYALGEILLIIVGILIAVNINERQATKKDDILRCQYLEELKFSINYDIGDVKENIGLFERRNSKIKKLLVALENKKIMEEDSISNKIRILNSYVFFVQQSKSKIEELKYSNVNLITNRNLKNKILYYQESIIMPLLNFENRFDKVNDKVRSVLDSTIDLDELENNKYFISLVSRKYNISEGLKSNYKYILKEQNELVRLIGLELEEKCNK